LAAKPARPEAGGADAAVDAPCCCVVAVVVTLAALEDADKPPLLDEAPKAPQMLAGAAADVVATAEEEEEEEDPFPPLPLCKLAAREASPLSAVMLALGAGRDLAGAVSTLEEEVEEEMMEEEVEGADPSLTLFELRDLAGDFKASAEGVIVMLPDGEAVKVKVSLGVPEEDEEEEEEAVDEVVGFSATGFGEIVTGCRGSLAIFFMFFLHRLQYQTVRGSLTSASDIFGL